LEELRHVVRVKRLELLALVAVSDDTEQVAVGPESDEERARNVIFDLLGAAVSLACGRCCRPRGWRGRFAGTMVRPVTTNELRSLEARWRVGDITDGDLHSVADSLLAKGEDHSDVVAGTITPLEATRRADAINRRTDYRYAEPLKWADFYEELEYLDSSGLSYLGRDRASIEADIMALARSTLAS
jgi:hypothetical protein